MEHRRSLRTSNFKKQMMRLPEEVQEEAQRAFQVWKNAQSSLSFKSLDCAGGKVWSARINYRYRVMATELPMPDGTVCWLWFWAGSRESFEGKSKSAEIQQAQKSAVQSYQNKFKEKEKNAKRIANLAKVATTVAALSVAHKTIAKYVDNKLATTQAAKEVSVSTTDTDLSM